LFASVKDPSQVFVQIEYQGMVSSVRAYGKPDNTARVNFWSVVGTFAKGVLGTKIEGYPLPQVNPDQTQEQSGISWDDVGGCNAQGCFSTSKGEDDPSVCVTTPQIANLGSPDSVEMDEPAMHGVCGLAVDSGNNTIMCVSPDQPDPVPDPPLTSPCDIKIYFTWAGTDFDNEPFESAGLRISEMKKYSIASVVAAAGDLVYSSAPRTVMVSSVGMLLCVIAAAIGVMLV